MSQKDVDFQRGPWKRLWSNFIGGKRICAVSRDAEMYFWRIYSVVDDFGNMICEPILLHAATAGYRPMTMDEVVEWVNELAAVKLLSLYENDKGETFLHLHEYVAWQPAGPNGKRVRRHTESPWDAAESVRDYMHLGRQKVHRTQGESQQFRRGLPTSSALGDTPQGRRIDRGNPTHNNNQNKINNITLDDSLFRVVQTLDKAQFVVEVFEKWKAVMGFNESVQLSAERQRKIEARWKDSTLEEVFIAIEGCEADDFHMARGKYEDDNPHNDIKLICRDRSKVEQLMAKPRRRKQRSETQTHTEEGAKNRWQNK